MVKVVCALWRGCKETVRTGGASCSLAVTLVLVGCGGGGGGGSGPTTEAVTVSGRLHYEFVPASANCSGLNYTGTEQRPIRRATVQLVDADNNAVIGSVISGESGDYSFELPPGRRIFVRVRAELKRTGAPAWDVEVRDNTRNTGTALGSRPIYVLDSAPFTADSTQVLDLTAATGWDGQTYSGTRAAAPFAILDSVYSAMSLVLSAKPDVRFPPLDVFWSVNNSTASVSGFSHRIDTGQIGTSFYSPGLDSLFLLGKADDDTEEFDSHVIVHEWAHYFEDNLSRSDSIGGPHGLGERLDMRLAFSEGWATALSGMVLDDSLYCDTYGVGQRAGFGIPLEATYSSRPGWFNELSVISIFHDLWDNRPGDDDEGSTGFAPLLDTFLEANRETPAFTSVFSYMTALKKRHPEHEAFVNQLLGQHNINGVDIYGSDETNTGDAEDALPVYTQIHADAVPVELCTNDHQDAGNDGNKLSVFRFLRFPVQAGGRYRITMDNVDPPTVPGDAVTSDPDFLLFRRGQRLLSAQSGAANREEADTPFLVPGEYVLTASEYRYGDQNPSDGFPSRSCFEITIRPVL